MFASSRTNGGGDLRSGKSGSYRRWPVFHRGGKENLKKLVEKFDLGGIMAFRRGALRSCSNL